MTVSAADPAMASGTVATGDRRTFRAALERLSTRGDASSLDRVLQLAGPVLMPLGLLVIVLGWYGAANTTRVFLQIPYMISGGLIGTSLVFVGGFLYFSRWLNDLLDDNRRQAEVAQDLAERTAAALERIEVLLAAGPLPTASAATAPTPKTEPDGADAPAAPASPRLQLSSSAASDILVVTAKGSLVHRASCRLVAERETTVVDAVGARDRCRICRPPAG